MTIRKADLDHSGHTFLIGMVDPPIATALMHEAAGKQNDYLEFKIRELYEFIFSTFPGEEVLKNEVKRSFYSPIFNHTDDLRDRDDHHCEIAWNTSTKE